MSSAEGSGMHVLVGGENLLVGIDCIWVLGEVKYNIVRCEIRHVCRGFVLALKMNFASRGESAVAYIPCEIRGVAVVIHRGEVFTSVKGVRADSGNILRNRDILKRTLVLECVFAYFNKRFGRVML